MNLRPSAQERGEQSFPPDWARKPALDLRKLFVKDVFGAFTGTGLENWLRELGATEVFIVGFFAHMCLSTSSREALVRGFDVSVDPEATGAVDIEHPELGRQSADEVRRSALLQLSNMGVKIASSTGVEAGFEQVRRAG